MKPIRIKASVFLDGKVLCLTGSIRQGDTTMMLATQSKRRTQASLVKQFSEALLLAMQDFDVEPKR